MRLEIPDLWHFFKLHIFAAKCYRAYISAAYAVVRCLSVWVSVTFV